ncbi:2-hydroxymuconate tautomerase [Xanthobacter sp. 126]|jgi:4-oxalocrotonate tautomerase|uniref:2-hydroxymuconate tautomerase n=1 Tax=Xanthobacter sp. 126 TaxID=1131814 RepID=UPI00045E5A02|nr:2-hydroxymuconate tautomerase [Xanthobacter sp. 126]
MPIIEITMIEGRPFEKKKRMVKEVTDAIVASLDAPREAVRIIIREVPAWHFAAAGVVKGEPQ